MKDSMKWLVNEDEEVVYLEEGEEVFVACTGTLKMAQVISQLPRLLESLEDALAWIDAVPKDTELPAMSGFGRDEVNELIEFVKRGL